MAAISLEPGYQSPLSPGRVIAPNPKSRAFRGVVAPPGRCPQRRWMVIVQRLLKKDGSLLFATRILRLFAYGMLGVVLVLYLTGIGLTESQTGLLLTLTLLGDTTVSLLLTTRADRLGRRGTLIGGAALLTIAGIVFALTRNFAVLVIAGTIGIISQVVTRSARFCQSNRRHCHKL